MKVADLTGEQLDYWVARAEGMDPAAASFVVPAHAYSTEWAYGGPIIEREEIAIEPRCWGKGDQWVANRQTNLYDPGFSDEECPWTGPTPLIAAMRAHVASVFGAEVPDEESCPAT